MSDNSQIVSELKEIILTEPDIAVGSYYRIPTRIILEHDPHAKECGCPLSILALKHEAYPKPTRHSDVAPFSDQVIAFLRKQYSIGSLTLDDFVGEFDRKAGDVLFEHNFEDIHAQIDAKEREWIVKNIDWKEIFDAE